MIAILFDLGVYIDHLSGMDIEEAFRVLGIDRSSSLQQLNLSFRRLAKKYHPDFNKGKEKWANNKMTILNLAYETALQYFTSPSSRIDSSKKEEEFHWNFNRAFNRAKDMMMEGILIFYKYGLENVHLRREGVRRIRYADANRYMEKSISLLNRAIALSETGRQKGWCRVMLDFSTAFLRNMRNSSYFRPTGNAYEDKAYWHYREGSVLLDDVIKEVMLGKLVRQTTAPGSFYNKLARSYNEFVYVISEYPQSSWVVDTIFKMHLIEMLGKVIKLFKDLIY